MNEPVHSVDICHVDTCLPGFFVGYSGPVLAVPVDNTTTASELRSLLDDEFRNTEPEDVPISEAEFDRAIEAMMAAVQADDEPLFPRLSPCRSDDEPVMAYFSLTVH